MDRGSLTLLQHNIESLKPKLALISHLLETQKVDVCILNETWLRPSDSVKIRGYDVYRQDGENGRGGVAIFCKTTFKSRKIITQSSDKVQTLAISLKLQNSSLTILGVYCPPRNGRFPIAALKNVITSLASPVLVMGDFNAHHTAFGSHSNKPRGIQLYDLIEEVDMIILNTGETTTLNRPNQSPSAIDIAFISPCLAASADWHVFSEDTLGSYHFPTIVNLDVSIDLFEIRQSYEKFLYDKADWISYKKKSKTLFNDLLFESNSILAYDKFCQLLNELRNEFVPLVKNYNNSFKCHKPVPWWNDTCAKAVKESKLALHVYKRYPTIENYMVYKKIDASKKLIIKEQKKSSWQTFCSNFDRNTPISQVWKLVKRFNCKYKSPKSKEDGFVNDFLTKIASDQVLDDPEHLNEIFDKNDLNTHLNLPFSKEELHLSINSKKDTTPGLDSFPYILIKLLDETAKLVLLNIYNKLWQANAIPVSWKKIAVVPILKPEKDPAFAESYRPISLSSCIGKIFENMIKNRLEIYAESRLLIPPDQFGFRKGCSTVDSLVAFGGDINQAFLNNNYLVSTFLDVSGAFDNVNLITLVNILHSFNIPGKVCQWIFNFFYSREVYIKFNQSLYGPKLAFKGIMQGATLSPLMYSLYTSLIHKYVSLPNLSVLQYADDIVLYTTDKNISQAISTLNKSLDLLFLYYKHMLNLDINPQKSSALIFSKKVDFYPVNINLRYCSVPINFVEEKKFLGLVFDSKMTFNSHVVKVVNRMQKSVNIMRYLASVSWGMDPKLLNMIYKAIVRSHYDYGLIIYGKFLSQPLFRKLEVTQNKGLRIITGAMCSTPINSLEIEAGIPPILVRLKYLAEKFCVKVLANKNYQCRYVNNMIVQSEKFNDLKDICKCIGHSNKWELGTLEIQITKPSICQKKIMSNEEFLHFVNTEKSEYRYIYTDGSKTKDATKAAYYDSRRKFGRCFTLDKNASIFTAESYAIYTALQYIMGITDANKFLIITDSLSVLSSLENPKISYKNNLYITGIRQYINENPDKLIEFLWVPAHRGITGNEVVDKFMKIQAPQFYSLYPAPAVPFTDYFSLLKIRMFENWRQEWENTKMIKGKWYGHIQESIPSKPWFFKLKSSHTRRFIVTINRLRFGHGKFPAHLKRLNFIRSDICEHCNNEQATLDHLMLHCPAFNVQRLILIDGLLKIYKDEDIPRLLPSLLRNTKTYDEIYKYVISTFQEI